MTDKIYSKESEEYQSYGHYVFDNEHYYSLEQYKSEFLFETSTRDENQADSDRLKPYRSYPTYKTKPEKGNDQFVTVYNKDLLDEVVG